MLKSQRKDDDGNDSAPFRCREPGQLKTGTEGTEKLIPELAL